ncbi:MAG: molybdopterin biosynthesis protein [Nitrososphaeria archaeon]
MSKIFHNLVSVEEALKLIESSVSLQPVGVEDVDLTQCLGRVLSEDVFSPIDSPPFDRSEVDGYAVSAEDVAEAEDDRPAALKIVGFSEVGRKPEQEIGRKECMRIATGAPLPRGADSVVMIEYTKEADGFVNVYKPVVQGENIAQAGSDYVLGDLFLRKGSKISSREVASLSALGLSKVRVYVRPTVGLFSSGNEIVPPGERLTPGKVYDANGPALYSMVVECGGKPSYLGILPDEYEKMYRAVASALEKYDMVITSGSTSAGIGDMMYRVFDSVGRPGIVVHGLKIKPGKPTIAAAAENKLLFGLPGFPVSAMMVFSILVKPILNKMAGSGKVTEKSVSARTPFKVTVGKGRRTLLPVSVINNGTENIAYPTPGGSGSVSLLNYSDGFIDVPEYIEFLDEDEKVEVKLFSERLNISDLNIIGSHCPAVELILSDLETRYLSKVVNVGSLAGWRAIARKEADIAGTHLLDEETLQYNVPFLQKHNLKAIAVVVKGYRRQQGIITLKNNPKNIRGIESLLEGEVRFINRNRGSGTRTFLDHNLRRIAKERGEDFVKVTEKIQGYTYEAKTHSAVALSVAQGRADAGIGLEFYSEKYGLGFIPLTEEEYDFVVLNERLNKPAVRDFIDVLKSKEFRSLLESKFKGYTTTSDIGRIVC